MVQATCATTLLVIGGRRLGQAGGRATAPAYQRHIPVSKSGTTQVHTQSTGTLNTQAGPHARAVELQTGGSTLTHS